LSPCLEHGQKGNSAGYGGKWVKVDGGRKKYMLHRLAYCEAAGVPIESITGYVVRHRCDNPRCINPEHLELGTTQDNVDDMWGRGRASFGERHGATLTADDVKFIRESPDKGVDLAARFGVSASHISRVRRGLKRKRED